MKQLGFQGWGAAHLGEARQPVDMPVEIVTMCRDTTDAVRLSLDFAKRRHGFSQVDVSRMCGWRSSSYLSEIKKGHKQFPTEEGPQLAQRFCEATRCMLLLQVLRRDQVFGAARGGKQNALDGMTVARMVEYADKRVAA